MASQIAMGAWAIGGSSWWGDNDDNVSIATIHQALDGGINLLDTAPVYGFGHSEEVVGRAIRDRRSKVILSTKCGLTWHEEEPGSPHFSRDGYHVKRNLSPQSLRRGLEESLRRLQTDYIDIFITHWQSAEPYFTPVEETMGELMRMKQEGKIRAIGASNVQVAHMEAYRAVGQLDLIQEKYSMLDRKVEPELLPYCEKNGITLQCYSPLEQGLLAGKAGMDYQVKPGEVRDNKKWWKMENRRTVLELLEAMKPYCEKYQCTLANLVISWQASRSEQINVLCGARKAYQIEDILNTAKIALSPQDAAALTALADAAAAKGVD